MTKKLVYALTMVAAVACIATSCKKDKDTEPTQPTNPEPTEEAFFQFTITDITGDGVTVVTTPKDTVTLFYCDILTKESYETYESDSALVADYVAYFNENVDKYKEYYGIDVTLADLYLYHNVDEYTYSGLDASTDYYAMAFRLTEEGVLVGKLEKEPFRTADVVPSDIKFDIAIDTVTVDSINLVITPSNEDPYMAYLFAESELADYDNDEEALRDVESFYQMFGYTLVSNGGTYFPLNSWVEESGKQILLVAGYQGGFTTEITRFEFDFEATTVEEGESEEESQAAPAPIKRSMRHTHNVKRTIKAHK